MNIMKWGAFSAILIGAINWGLIGAFNFDLVSFLFGEMTWVTRIIYMLVGLSAICYLAFILLDRYTEDTSCFN